MAMVEHLFRTACGLNSMVIGEIEKPRCEEKSSLVPGVVDLP